MATLLLPEFLELLAFSELEGEGSLLDSHLVLAEIGQHFTFYAQLAHSDVTTMGVHAGVDELKLGEVSFDLFLHLLPVNLEFLAIFDLSSISQNDGVVEILLHEDCLAVFIPLIFLLFFFLICSLQITFLFSQSNFIRQGFVASSSDFETLYFNVLAILASLRDLISGPFFCFNVVAVKEVGDCDVPFLVCLDLLAEEFVFCQVGIRKVVLNLDFNLHFFCVDHFCRVLFNLRIQIYHVHLTGL